MEKKQIVKPPVLYKETQQLISKIEKKAKVKILSYWNSDYPSHNYPITLKEARTIGLL